MSFEINSIRQNYDTSNPVVAEILKLKEERLKILQELNKQQEEEFRSFNDSANKIERKKKPTVKKDEKADKSFPTIALRRSTRLVNSPVVKYHEVEYKPEVSRIPVERPPNDYGPMPGVEVGFHWETRMECSLYGVHRPTVAGIHGGPNGAYSIALSGGYPEDIDEGDSFIYTGAGGRDLKGTASNPKNLRVAPQTKDQQLEGTNLSLAKSVDSKLPIRVIRGYKSPSIFAPETGYRYDGLYQAVKFWEDVGKTGYRIYRFKLERIKDQAPPPWSADFKPPSKVTKNLKSEEDSISNFDSDELDYKENISPLESNDTQLNLSSVNDNKILDIDSKIEECIFFLINCRADENQNDLKEKSTDENFLGWDKY